MSTADSLEPRKRPIQRRSKEMVRAILDATARVLVEEGYDRASTNRIAHVAGVSVGSLYQYFGSKEALVFALAREHSDEMISMLARSVVELAGLPVHEVVERYVGAMFDAHRVDPELHLALVQQVLQVGLEPYLTVQEQARTLVRGWLEAHRDQLLPRDLDAAAYMLVTTVEAVIHGALLEDPARLDDPALQRELVAMIQRYLGCTP